MSPVAVVAGALANKPGNGGEAWVRLSWVRGLQRLGFETWLIEQIDPRSCRRDGARATFLGSENVAWFRQVCDRFGLSETAALVCGEGTETHGASLEQLLELSGRCDLLLNISGHLHWQAFLERAQRTVYLDIDPGFTQFWQLQGTAGARLEGHDVHFTIAENIGAPGCEIPDVGMEWRRTRPPVVLDDWPVVSHGDPDRLTTVASWRGAYGPIEHRGRRYGLKVHEFRRFVQMPARAPQVFEMALAIDPADEADRILLADHGWRITDPANAAGDPTRFRRYVQGSGGEFSVAQGMYVETRSGWFSDRTVRYLASGKPAIVQDTGFGASIPHGEGLLAFATLDEAVTAAESVAADPEGHSRAARRIAEDHFDSDRVIERLLDDAAVGA
jgi:hypothetical protein